MDLAGSERAAEIDFREEHHGREGEHAPTQWRSVWCCWTPAPHERPTHCEIRDHEGSLRPPICVMPCTVRASEGHPILSARLAQICLHGAMWSYGC